MSNIIPYVVERTSNGERSYDLFSRLMEDRILILTDEITSSTASIIVPELLYLAAKGNDPINMYINSPGGSVRDGLAIIDTMNKINAPVYTTVFGTAASMAAVILASGEKGNRMALKHSLVMIHQVYSGARGKITDMKIAMREAERALDEILDILVDVTGKKREEIEAAIEIDNYMNAEEAIEFGLLDRII